MRLIYCSIIIILSHSYLNAQVLNIDRENGQDTIPKNFGMVMGVDFASDKQQNDFIELSSSSELDFFLKNDLLIVLFVFMVPPLALFDGCLNVASLNSGCKKVRQSFVQFPHHKLILFQRC